MFVSRACTVAASALAVIMAGSVVTGATAASAATSVAPPTVTVSIAKDHTVKMPTRMRPGVHRFVVGSTGVASFQLLRLRAGYTKANAARDLEAALNSDAGDVKALKRVDRNTIFFGGASSSARTKGVLYVDLPAGSYLALDSDAPHTRAAKMLTLQVAGSRVAGTVPQATTVRALKGSAWAAAPGVIPAKGTLRLTNAGDDNHLAQLVRLQDGKTVADFKAWVQAAKAGHMVPPPIDEKAPTLDAGVLSPGRSMTQRYALRPGEYVLLCWWPNATRQGMPHTFSGMYRQVTVR